MKLAKENAPAANRGAFSNHNPAGLQCDSNITARLLDRLERVEKHGTGYRADCPSGHRSRGTLAITVADDGRILLHCFAGCESLAIVHALGLQLADLFPKRIGTNMTPAERRLLRLAAKQVQWASALSTLQHEARIIQVAGAQIRSGEQLNDTDTERLNEALGRIESARRVLND